MCVTKGCALVLLLGGDTHMTVAFVCDCEDTSTLIADVVKFLKANWIGSSILPIQLGPMMPGMFSMNSRCIGGRLADLKVTVMGMLGSTRCVERGPWGDTPHTQVLFGSECRTPGDGVDIFDTNNWAVMQA